MFLRTCSRLAIVAKANAARLRAPWFGRTCPTLAPVLQGLVGELVDFDVERPPVPAARPRKPVTLPSLPPLAAALSAEAHLLASIPPDVRPPDILGMGGVMILAALARGRRAERTAAA